MPLTTVQLGMQGTPQFYGFKNRFINGQMVIDQRNNGASVSINNTVAYTVDRWYVGFVGGTGTAQRVSGTGGFQNAIRLTGGSGITLAYIGQKIESFNSADLAGTTVTVSFRASSSTVTNTFGWVARFPNSQDNYSGVTSIGSGSITISSTPTNYSFSFTCPSGVTNGLEIYFQVTNFTSGTLDITGVQLEIGSTATSFDFRPYGTELALCQRYFQQLDATSVMYTRWNLGYADTATGSFTLPVRMRGTPTFSVTGLAGKNVYNMASDLNINAGTPTLLLDFATTTSARLYLGGGSTLGGTSGAPLNISTAGAICSFSAEL